MLQSLNARAMLVSIGFLVLVLGVWEFANPAPDASKPLTEYEILMGGADQEARVPPPSAVIIRAFEELSNPFYDAGPNDKGIGIQLAYSIYRVLTGFMLAALLAIPVGFLIGMSPLMYKALNPFIQVLRPISPLAWMPLALFIIKDSETSSIFVTMLLLQEPYHPVALLTAENMELCVRHGLGCRLPLDIRARTESYGIVTRRDGVLSPAANLMVAALRQVAQA